MDQQRSREPRQRSRNPLADATTRINNTQPPALDNSTPYSSPKLPHHESLKPEGNLHHLLNTSKGAGPSIANPRLSAVVDEHQPASNRNSQISNASTNASRKSKRKTHVGPWQLGTDLGRGATARVRLARHVLTGQEAAIKIVSKQDAVEVDPHLSLTNIKKIEVDPNGDRLMPFGIEREVVIMKLIEHPNIIRLYDIWENRGEL